MWEEAWLSECRHRTTAGENYHSTLHAVCTLWLVLSVPQDQEQEVGVTTFQENIVGHWPESQAFQAAPRRCRNCPWDPGGRCVRDVLIWDPAVHPPGQRGPVDVTGGHPKDPRSRLWGHTRVA